MLHPYYKSSRSTSPLILPAKLISAVSALAAVVADPPSSLLSSLSDWPNPLLLLILR